METFTNPAFDAVYKVLKDDAGHRASSSATKGTTENTARAAPLNILSWKAFDEIAFPEAKWLIKDLLPAGGSALLAAPSGEKKSWIALDMALCIALGVPFAGQFETQQAKVLYIEQETPRREIQRRGRILGFDGVSNDIFLLAGTGDPLNDDDAAKAVFSFVEEHDIRVVFIDTLRSVAGGMREEKAEEVRRFFERFRPWKEKGVSVVILDHCRKPMPFEGSGHPKKEQILGSQDKVAAVDIVHMTRSKERSEEISFYTVKSKVGKEAAPFKLRLIIPEEGDDGKATLTYDGEIDDRKLKSEEAEELIHAFLLEHEEQKAKEIVDALRGKTGKSAVEDALRSMREEDTVGWRKDGPAYIYFTKLDGAEKLPNDDLGSPP